MEQGIITGQFKIQKQHDDQQIAFGWAYMSVTKSGEQLVDHSGDVVDISEIEKAAYKFVKLYREGSARINLIFAPFIFNFSTISPHKISKPIAPSQMKLLTPHFVNSDISFSVFILIFSNSNFTISL